MQYENGKHKSASESDIQEVLSKQGQSVLHITYLTWVSLGQILSPTIDWEREWLCCSFSSPLLLRRLFPGQSLFNFWRDNGAGGIDAASFA